MILEFVHNHAKSRRQSHNAPVYEDCLRCKSIGGICICEQGRMRPSMLEAKRQHDLLLQRRAEIRQHQADLLWEAQQQSREKERVRFQPFRS